MRKRLISLALCLLLCLTAAVPALAATKSYIVDELAKLSAEELAALNQTAAGLEQEYGFYVGLVMTENTGDGSLIAYLRATFEQNAAGADGILLGYDPQAKKWAALRVGKAQTVFSEADEDALWALFAAGETWYTSVDAYLTSVTDRLAAAGGSDEPPAEQPTHRLCDAADLLTASEESTLLAQLNDVSERQNCDVVVVTTDTLNGKTPMTYADDYYDEHDYGPDGVLLLVSMEDRDWYISTAGFGITAVTDAGREAMADLFLGDLSAGNYLTAFSTYAQLCDDYWTQANTGNPYDVGNLDDIPGYSADDELVSDRLTFVVISLGIGLVVAFIGTAAMKSKLKSVRRQPAAASYLKTDSLHITQARETFLYRHVNRVAKPQSSSSGGSSTHSSSSGVSHGGGGGKF